MIDCVCVCGCGVNLKKIAYVTWNIVYVMKKANIINNNGKLENKHNESHDRWLIDTYCSDDIIRRTESIDLQ